MNCVICGQASDTKLCNACFNKDKLFKRIRCPQCQYTTVSYAGEICRFCKAENDRLKAADDIIRH